MTIYEEKKNLRQKMRRLIKEKYTDEELRFKASRAASEKIVEKEVFKNADYIFMYIPKQPEADDMFLEFAGEHMKKNICVPRVLDEEACKKNGTECQMEFFLLDRNLDLTMQLFPGAYGILEPSLELELVDVDTDFLKDKNVLMIVPGTAFTKDGKRMGQGKGYYDRFIPRLKATGCNLYTIGFAYPEQIVENLPVEKTDILLDEVVTA